MVDPATGELVLAASGVRLGPAWSRARFLASALGSSAELVKANEPWARYWTGPRAAWSASPARRRSGHEENAT